MTKGKGKEFARLNKPPQEGASPPAVPTTTNPSPPSSSSAAAAVDPAQVVAESLLQQNHARQVAANSQHPQQAQTSVPPQQVPPGTNPPGGQQQQQLPQALKPNAPPRFKQQLPTSAPTQAQKLQAQQQEHTQRQIQAQQRQQQQQGGMAVPQSNISSANNNNMQPKVMLQQPTQRPDYSDARLSTMDIKSTSAKDISQSTTPVPIIGEKLQKLCNSIDPSYKLDADVQERLLEMADSFVEKVTKDAIKLSKHRGSKSMDVVDVALALKKGYNMSVPGLGPPSVAGNAKGGDNVMGGWLFADKVNASGEGGPANKKQKTG